MLGTWLDIGTLILYFVIMASSALLLRAFVTIPNEPFRKLLHFILLGSFPIFAFVFDRWIASALTSVLFAIVVYPILKYAEHWKKYSEFTTERKHGELKSSLIHVFFMFALVIMVCRGWLQDPWLALVSIYAWGIGDAFAALVGKKYGVHKIRWPGLDGKKSLEGSAAMFLLSFLSTSILLSLRGGMSLGAVLITSMVVAFVSAIAELYSQNGNDTVICPVSAMVALIPCVWFFGGLV